MQLREAQRILREQYGIRLQRTQARDFRVNFIGGRKRTAYYTTDLEDAFNTGVTMAQSNEK